MLFCLLVCHIRKIDVLSDLNPIFLKKCGLYEHGLVTDFFLKEKKSYF